MRTLAFAKRNNKEISRDIVAIGFVLGMPLLMLLIWSIIAKAVPGGFMPANFQLQNYIPGVALFGMTFLSMFLGILMAQDRSQSFLSRLFAGPMRTEEYLMGYSLPMIPFALCEIIIVLVLGMFMGLQLSLMEVLFTIGLLLCCVPLFLSIGMFLGSSLNERAVAPLSSILVQLMALTSGMMLDVDSIGGIYAGVCKLLPFYHALKLSTGVSCGNMEGWGIHAAVVAGYTLVMFALARIVFKKKQQD